MKSMEGSEAAKTKSVRKALLTKSKAKKPRVGNAKGVVTKKKSTSTKKRPGEVLPRKKRITDTDKRSTASQNRNRNSRINRFHNAEPNFKDSNEANNNDWRTYNPNGEDFESDACWNENYSRLQEFHSTYGHSAVPTSWSADPKFAEWVTYQRHIFREIHMGHRTPSLREQGRWNRLRVLKFPLDYGEWHWRRRYKELMEALHGSKYDETTTKLPEPLAIWIDHQKSLLESGVMNIQRRIDLEALGVVAQRRSSPFE